MLLIYTILHIYIYTICCIICEIYIIAHITPIYTLYTPKYTLYTYILYTGEIYMKDLVKPKIMKMCLDSLLEIG